MVFILKFLAVFFGIFLRLFRRRRKEGEPVHCLLVGYGGANNTGAEARTDEAIKQMRSVIGDRLHITVTSLSRDRSLRYTSEDEHVRIVQMPSVFMFKVAWLVMRADVVVLVEGYCFMQSFTQILLWLFLYAANLAQRLKIPTMTYAVDAGQLAPANAAWTKRVVERMDLVIMRTRQAANALREMGVHREMLVTTDTVFTLKPSTHIWAKSKFAEVGFDATKPVIGIAFEEFFWWPVVPALGKFLRFQSEGRYKSFYYHTWTPERHRKSDAMKRAIASFADWAAREYDANVAFFAMERVNADPCHEVMRMMERPSALFDSDRYDAHEMAALIMSMKFLMTSEYHATLLALMGAVPMIGLGHDERIPSVMEELNLKHDFYIHYDEDRIGDRLQAKSQMLMEEEEIVKGQLAEALPAYLERMKANGEHFRKFINKLFP